MANNKEIIPEEIGSTLRVLSDMVKKTPQEIQSEFNFSSMVWDRILSGDFDLPVSLFANILNFIGISQYRFWSLLKARRTSNER